MPFDPQGNFTRVMNWQDDAANSIPIVASRHDDEDDNFAQGLSNTLCRDGRAAMTGNLKMGSFKITGLGNGTTTNDAVNKSQLDGVQSNLSSSINTLDGAVVKLTGNQTIAGTKTFSSSPIVPTPTAGDNSKKTATTAFVTNAIKPFLMFPDYANRVSKNADTDYTAEFDGFLFVHGMINSGQRSITINGVSFMYVSAYGDGGAGSSCMFPVKAGDTFRSDGANNFALYLIPFRG